MNYKDFNLGDWIGHISGVIEDETTLDGNEMRDLVEFLTTLQQEPCEDAISRQAVLDVTWEEPSYTDALNVLTEVRDKVKALPPVNPQKPKSEWEHDHEILKAYSDGANAVLDKIRAEIEHMIPCSKEALSMKLGVLEIIDRYTKDGE